MKYLIIPLILVTSWALAGPTNVIQFEQNGSPTNVSSASPLPVTFAASGIPVSGSVSVTNFPAIQMVTWPSALPVSVASPLPVSGSVSVQNFPSPVPTQTVTWPSPLPVSSSVNSNGHLVDSMSIGSGSATTLSPPTNSVGFILEASSSNTNNLRWSIGSTASATNGMRLEPGRDSNYVPTSASVSVIAEAGSSQEVTIQWILSQ